MLFIRSENSKCLLLYEDNKSVIILLLVKTEQNKRTEHKHGAEDFLCLTLTKEQFSNVRITYIAY